MASLNGTKAPEKGAQRHGKKKGRVNGRKRAVVVTEERVAAERTALVAEKQGEIETVLDRHDTLVSGME